MEKIIICIDIIGVIKEAKTTNSFEGAIESIKTLASKYNLILIENGKKYTPKTLTDLLESEGIKESDSLKLHYYAYEELKETLIPEHKVTIAIDDELNSVAKYSSDVTKIWYCPSVEKINGAKQWQPSQLEKVQIAINWENCIEIITTEAEFA